MLMMFPVQVLAQKGASRMSGMQPTHIAQIAVTVGDLERAKRFYGDSLGLAHLFDAPPGLSFFQCARRD